MGSRFGFGWLVLSLLLVATVYSEAPVFQPRTVRTEPIRMTGMRPDPEPPGEDLSRGFAPRTIRTAPIRMTGVRPDPEPPGEDLSRGFTPRTVRTAPIRMTGMRP